MKKQNEHNGSGQSAPDHHERSQHQRSQHEELCAYVLGELNAAEAEAMERTLQADEALRAERDRLQATIGMVTSACAGAESFSPAILETLERAAKPIPRITPWYSRAPLKAAAGLVALVTGVVGGRALMQDGKTQAPPGTTESLARFERGGRDAGRRMGKASLPVSQNASADSPDQLVTSGEATTVAPSDSNGFGQSLGNPVTRAAAASESRNKESVNSLDGGGRPIQPQAERSEELATFYGLEHAGVHPVVTEDPKDSSILFLGEAVAPDPTGSAVMDHLGSLGYAGGGGGGGAPAAKPGQVAQTFTSTLAGISPPSAGGPSTPGPSGGTYTGPGSTLPSVRGRYKAASGQDSGLALRFEAVNGLDSAVNGLDSFGREVSGGFYFESDTDSGREAVSGADDFYLGAGLKSKRVDKPKSAEQLGLERTKWYLDHCRRLPNESPRDMFFRFWGDNAFELAQLDAQSTFSADVDTASYALARRYLKQGNLPTKAQIRTEEFVNYFKPDLAAPSEGVFAIHTELAPSRFGNDPKAPSQRWMLRVGVRGKDVAREERKALALTFVVDTSGSMKEDNRLELVKHSLRLLVSQLDAGDSIAIVGFNNSASLVLPMTSAQSRGIIEAAIFGLTANGGTNAEGGLNFGYEVAAEALTGQAHNRVVLLSDGVANIGQTDQDRINESIRNHRESGIYLNTIGVGMDNHNDVFLEQLANKGDGLCNYVDTPEEARRALVENFTGAFEPIARDVKIQAEFDPAQVYRYRLLGYENRAIADADFRNDAVDAGEVGAGHQVVALYELELTGAQSSEPFVKVNLRWKAPTGAGRDPLEDAAVEINTSASMTSATDWEGASAGYRRSVLVAQFAEILRRSVHARGDSLDDLLRESEVFAATAKDADFTEFFQLLIRSRELIVKHAHEETDLSNCIDALRRNRILRAQLETLRKTENQEVLNELEAQNAKLEGKIRDLIKSEIQKQVR